MTAPKKQSRLTEYLLIFALVYVVVTVFFPGQKNDQQQVQTNPVTLTAQSDTFRIGTHPILLLKNPATRSVNQGWMAWVGYQWCRFTSDDCTAVEPRSFGPTVSVASKCPAPPVGVSYVKSDGSSETRTSSETVVPRGPVTTGQPGEGEENNLGAGECSIFYDIGPYNVTAPGGIRPGTRRGGGAAPPRGTSLAARVVLRPPQAVVKLFRALVTKPILNAMVFIGGITPGHSLALAIVLITLLIKFILFIPTQHAMEGQKKMQLLQPKLEAVRAKYPNDPQKVNEETMKLWKEHGVNPLQSCLPLLLQFPLLIGLLYAVESGANIALAREYIYGFNQNLSWSFNNSLFGIDLTKPEVFIFPILLIVLQFFQMKLSFAIADKKKAKEVEKAEETPGNAMAMQQKMMTYVLPFMIGFFALRFPAAVALYWGVSTLFAIGQQVIVNREHLSA